MLSQFYKNLKLRKTVLGVLLSIILVTTPAAVFLTPQQASAQWTTFDVNALGSWMWTQVKTAATWAWEHGAAIAFKNAARTFTTNVARDSAVMLASGGQGQTPLFTWKNLGKSAQDAWDGAVGDFVDTLGSENGYIDLGLCNPSSPQAKLIINYTSLQEALPNFGEPAVRTARCSWSDMRNNWDAILGDPEKRKDLLKNFGLSFKGGQHDLDIALGVQTNIIKSASDKKEIQKALDTVSDTFKPVTEAITGLVKTPAGRIRSQQETALQVASQDFSTYTGDIVADALGVFTNTLAARLIKRMTEGDISKPSQIGSLGIFSGDYGGYGLQYATQLATSITTPQLVGGVDIDVISDFLNCPQNYEFAELNNCTIDNKFAQALREADSGRALTLAEAVDRGLVNGQWVFKDERPKNARTPDAWYLSDIKKLRAARIVPLGWELAAQKSFSADVSLKDVMNKFADTNSPYYHLIDPNWILKAVPEQCRMMGPGQILQAQGSSRADSCVDVQHCVAQNEDGSCNAWGYCTREQNIWRFGAESCDFPEASGVSPYASCLNFTSSSGETNSWLQNSLSGLVEGTCNGAAGCRWYSKVYTGSVNQADRYLDGKYCSHNSTISCLTNADCNKSGITGSVCQSPRIYLKNKEKYTCDAKDEGCSEFLRLSSINTSNLGSGANPVEQVVNKLTNSSSSETYSDYAKVQNVYLKSAPANLNCYDADKTNDSPECARYLTMCAQADVGCELFTPTDGSPAIPAKIDLPNTCPAQCVGYQSYEQQTTFFEPAPAVVDNQFISKTAKVCPVEAVGCEEFTNVSANETKEYFVELRQCIKPGDAAEANYYTWIGSDLSGYQLKMWTLKQGTNGPATTDGVADCRGASTTFPTADPDCKQFYDSNGAVTYKFATKTISVSEACSKYRKTSSTAIADCVATGGQMETVNNKTSCFYKAIPTEGKKCGAQYNGCREYKGPTGNNTKLVFPVSTFGDNDAKTGWPIEATPSSGWYSGTTSNDSTVAFGHSFDSGSDSRIYKDISQGITKGQQYVVSFWAKKSALGGVTLGDFNTDVASTDLISNNGKLSTKPKLATAWQNFTDQWTQVKQVSAQVSPISLTASPAQINNSSFSSSASTTLSWSASTSNTDKIVVSINNNVLSAKTYLPDSRCKNGSRVDNSCTVNNDCRDLSPICQPVDFKCNSGLKKDLACSDNNFCQQLSATCDGINYKCVGGPYNGQSCNKDDAECRNSTATCNTSGKCTNNNSITCAGINKNDPSPCRSTTATCQPEKKICSNETTKTCTTNANCQYPTAQCLSTAKKCSGGYRNGLSCSVNNDCVDPTPICINDPTGPKSGSIAVNLPTQVYPDHTLPVSQEYTLTVNYYSPTGSNTVTQKAVVSVNNPPGSFKINAPINNQTNLPTNLTITWSSSPRATMYKVTLNGQTFTINNPNLSFTAPADLLQPNTQYTAVVKAYNEGGQEGATVPQVTFKTSAASSSPFNIVEPVDDPSTPEIEPETIDNDNFNISWTRSQNATSYIVTVTQDNIVKYLTSSTTLSIPTKVPSNALSRDVDCKIVVIAMSGGAANATAERPNSVYGCHMLRLPTSPTPIEPGGSGTDERPDTIESETPLFRWQRSQNLYHRPYKLLELQQQNKDGGYNEKATASALTQESVTSAILLSSLPGNKLVQDVKYRWRVTADNSAGVTVSPWKYFVVHQTTTGYGGGGVTLGGLPNIIGSKKSVPVPSAPTNPRTALTVPQSPYQAKFEWDQNINTGQDNETLGYTIYRGDNGGNVRLIGCVANSVEGCTSPLVKQFTDDGSKYPFKDGSRYVYQVRAFNEGGESKGVSSVINTQSITPPTVDNDNGGGTPTAGQVIIKINVNGQAKAGGLVYSVNNSTTGNTIPINGYVMTGQASGEYKLSIQSSSAGPQGITGAELDSIEASPGGAITCVGAPCGAAAGVLLQGQSLVFTVNYVTAADTLAETPLTSLRFNIGTGGSLPALSNDWQYYTFGPVTLSDSADLSKGVRVELAGGQRFVVDNVILQQVNDTIYANKNSWNTPSQCQDDKYLGCKEYTDRQKVKYALTGFSKICKQAAVGCEVLVDTKNSSSPKSATITIGQQTITTPKDEAVYRVYDTSKSCGANSKGCQRLGLAATDSLGQIVSWGDTFWKLQPDTYVAGSANSPLCSEAQDRCEEFKSNNQVTYFKDPGEQLCEYRQVDVNEPYNWYKKGTNELCNLVPNGSFEKFSKASNSAGTYFNNSGVIDDNIQDAFIGWNRNGESSYDNRGHLYAQSSINGYYWGESILRVESTPVNYSGVWSDMINIGDSNVDRYFAISAKVYIPGTITTDWQLSQHAYNNNVCQGGTCHHYDYVNSDGDANSFIKKSDPKKQWLVKTVVVKVRKNEANMMSVGIIANIPARDPSRISNNESIYIDDVKIISLPLGISGEQAISAAEVAYANICPSEMNSCKAFHDPGLTKKTYYYLDNNKVDRTSCAGKVSEKDGCLLFNDMSKTGEANWQAATTYQLSRSQDSVAVGPQSASGICSNNASKSCYQNSDCAGGQCQLANNDANTIIKVRRDRGCAEWLACQTSTTITDQTGKTRELCYSLGRCNQVATNKSAGQCGNWLDPENQAHPLDEGDYVGRDVTWSGQEYTGYSVPGLCSLDMVSSSPICGFSAATAKGCRVYPETDSPYPSTVAQFDGVDKSAKIMSRKAGFKDANVCQPGEDCECGYKRVSYKNGETRFVGYRSMPDDLINKVPEGVTCNNCGSDSNCSELCAEQSRIKQVNYAYGLKGYCLERDSSRSINGGEAQACLTWLPLDVIQGETSLFDDKPEAGFTPQRTDGNLLYCLETRSNATVGSAAPYTTSGMSNKNRKVQITHTNDCNNEGLYVNSLAIGNFIFGSSVTDVQPNNTCNIADYVNCDQNTCATFTNDSQYIAGVVDNDLQFSVSVGDFEKKLGGLQAIDSIDITYDFTSGLRKFKPSVDIGGGTTLRTIRVSRAKTVDTQARDSCFNGVYDHCEVQVTFNPDDENTFLKFKLLDFYAGATPFKLSWKYNLREWCQSLAQVVDTTQYSGVTNKAQTDRTFDQTKYAGIMSGLFKYQGLPGVGSGGGLKEPYGAVADSPLILNPAKEVWVTQKKEQPIYEGQPVASAAINCGEHTYAGFNFTCGGWMCLASGTTTQMWKGPNGQTCTVSGTDAYCGKVPNTDPDDPNHTTIIDAGRDNICTGFDPLVASKIPKNVSTTDQKVAPLRDIFTSIYKIYNWRGRCNGTGLMCETDSQCSATPGATCQSYKYRANGKCVGGSTSGSICELDSDCAGGWCKYDADYNIDVSSNTNLAYSPILSAVTYNATGKVLGEDQTANFSLASSGKSHTTDNVVGISPVGITASFYGYNLNGNQMPIRFVGVDWDVPGRTDKNITIQASLKNHKHICAEPYYCSQDKTISCSGPAATTCGAKNECLANPDYNFGDSVNACVEDNVNQVGYFFYSNVYTCSGSGDPAWNRYITTGEFANSCQYKPKVGLRDNWGWWSVNKARNGAYSNGLPGLNVCANDKQRLCTNATKDCSGSTSCIPFNWLETNSSGRYIYANPYPAYVIVRPKTE